MMIATAGDPSAVIRGGQVVEGVGQWRATYTPGRWLLLAGPTSLVVLEPAPPHAAALVENLWESVATSKSLPDLAERLVAAGFAGMPSLAAFFWTPDGLRSLVRGAITVLDASSDREIATGAGVQTWNESGLGEVRVVRIVVEQPPEPALELPLVIGAAQVSRVVIDASPNACLVLTPPPAEDVVEPADSRPVEQPPAPDDEPGSGRGADAPVEQPPTHDEPASERVDERPGEPPEEPDSGIADEPNSGDEPPDGQPAPPDPAATQPFALPELTAPIPPVQDAALTEPIPPVQAAGLTEPIPPVQAPELTEPIPPVRDPGLTEPIPPVQAPELTVPVSRASTEVETRPLQDQVGDEPTEVFSAVGEAGRATPSVVVIGVTCPDRHSNPPGAQKCRVCAQPVAPQPPRPLPRPVLGRLRTSDGSVADVDRPVIIGRAPSDQCADGPLPRLLTVRSPQHDISRSHLQVAPDGWALTATDLGSTNGTLVMWPGSGRSDLLAPSQPTPIPIGTRLELGDGVSVMVEQAE